MVLLNENIHEIPNKDIHEIKFDNDNALTNFISLSNLVNFYHQDIMEMKQDYSDNCTLIYKRIIKDYIYEDFFGYYCSCKDSYTLLMRFSDANEKVLGILIKDALSAIKIMNNFDNYFP